MHNLIFAGFKFEKGMDFYFNKAKNTLVSRKTVCGIMSIKYIYFCFECTLYVENPCINSKEFHSDGLHELYKNIDFSSVLALVDVDVTGGSPGHL